MPEPTPATHLQCFLLGAEVGDAMEDVQQLTEDLVEQSAQATSVQTVRADGYLSNAWGDVRDLIAVARHDCGFADETVRRLVGEVDEYLKTGGLPISPSQIHVLRRKVDDLTARLALLENTS